MNFNRNTLENPCWQDKLKCFMKKICCELFFKKKTNNLKILKTEFLPKNGYKYAFSPTLNWLFKGLQVVFKQISYAVYVMVFLLYWIAIKFLLKEALVNFMQSFHAEAMKPFVFQRFFLKIINVQESARHSTIYILRWIFSILFKHRVLDL